MYIKDRGIDLLALSSLALVLAGGDAFHLVPRCLNYFIDYDFTPFLGVGKLVTSITMTIFYVVILFIIN